MFAIYALFVLSFLEITNFLLLYISSVFLRRCQQGEFPIAQCLDCVVLWKLLVLVGQLECYSSCCLLCVTVALLQQACSRLCCRTV